MPFMTLMPLMISSLTFPVVAWRRKVSLTSVTEEDIAKLILSINTNAVGDVGVGRDMILLTRFKYFDSYD